MYTLVYFAKIYCELLYVTTFVCGMFRPDSWFSRYKWMNEFYNIYPARGTRVASQGVYSQAVDDV